MTQGFFESDSDYASRIKREANEKTIGQSRSFGSHLAESDADYEERIEQEANEKRTGKPRSFTSHLMESDDDYGRRVKREANEKATGKSRSFSSHLSESDSAYDKRIEREADETTIGKSRSVYSHLFESDASYNKRVRREANQTVAGRKSPDCSPSQKDSGKHSKSSSRGSGSANRSDNQDYGGYYLGTGGKSAGNNNFAAVFGAIIIVGLVIVCLFAALPLKEEEFSSPADKKYSIAPIEQFQETSSHKKPVYDLPSEEQEPADQAPTPSAITGSSPQTIYLNQGSAVVCPHCEVRNLFRSTVAPAEFNCGACGVRIFDRSRVYRVRPSNVACPRCGLVHRFRSAKPPTRFKCRGCGIMAYDRRRVPRG